MGFFDKLFGGGKSAFTATADLMPEDRFWELIQASYDKGEGDPADQANALRSLLMNLPLKEVVLFENRYRQLYGQAYTWPLWGAAYIINGGCSDDGFDYFRDWLIAQGKEVYTQTLADPEWLVNLDLADEEIMAEEMHYVAASVYQQRAVVKRIPATYPDNRELSGPEWAEEGDDLARMFPKLWAKYEHRYEE